MLPSPLSAVQVVNVSSIDYCYCYCFILFLNLILVVDFPGCEILSRLHETVVGSGSTLAHCFVALECCRKFLKYEGSLTGIS